MWHTRAHPSEKRIHMHHNIFHMYNGLPISLRSANNLNSFKKALKTFLFKDAYNV